MIYTWKDVRNYLRNIRGVVLGIYVPTTVIIQDHDWAFYIPYPEINRSDIDKTYIMMDGKCVASISFTNGVDLSILSGPDDTPYYDTLKLVIEKTYHTNLTDALSSSLEWFEDISDVNDNDSLGKELKEFIEYLLKMNEY